MSPRRWLPILSFLSFLSFLASTLPLAGAALADYAIVVKPAELHEERASGSPVIRKLEPHEWGRVLVPAGDGELIRVETSAGETGWLSAKEVRVIPDFDRRDWRMAWPDLDRDCVNTRHEVLIAESKTPVVYRDARKCWVSTGDWTCPFSGEKAQQQKDMHIAHVVPLENAYLSGGYDWPPGQRRNYANDLGDPDHIVAISAKMNRERRGQGPERWRPPLESSWCWYARAFEKIKKRYRLSSTPGERTALAEMKATCPKDSETGEPPAEPETEPEKSPK